MQKILGLDIGTYSIKAVVLLNDYRAYKVYQYFEQLIEYEPGKDEHTAQKEALKKLLTENQITYDSVYVALDSQYVSMKRVEFQNIKKRDIANFLENELESTSPFAIEDSIIDFQLIEYSKLNSAVLAVICKKESVRSIIDLAENAGLNIKIIDIDNLAYLNLMPFLKEPEFDSDDDNEDVDKAQPKNTCQILINLGFKKTTLTFLNDKKVLFTRIINIAGAYFTESIRQEFDIKFEEAEALKLNIVKLNIAEFSHENKQQAVSLVLYRTVLELIGEISRTIQTFQEKSGQTVSNVILTGGSSRIEGIYEMFSKYLKLKVIPLEIDHQSVLYETSPDVPNAFGNKENLTSASQAIAIALRGLPLSSVLSKFNIRKGEFAQISNFDKLIKQIFLYSSAALVVIIFLMTSYFFRYWMYNKEINTIKQQFRKDVITMFSGEPYPLRVISAKSDWDFEKYSTEAIILLKQNLKDKKNILSYFSPVEIPKSLAVLNLISKNIPKEYYFEVSEFKIQDNILYVEADTVNSETVKKILESVVKSKSFKNVEKKTEEPKVGSDSKLIRFSFTATFDNGVI